MSESCEFCDRPLTSAKSRARGYGQKCGAKNPLEAGDIKLRRAGNVPLFDDNGEPVVKPTIEKLIRDNEELISANRKLMSDNRKFMADNLKLVDSLNVLQREHKKVVKLVMAISNSECTCPASCPSCACRKMRQSKQVIDVS